MTFPFPCVAAKGASAAATLSYRGTTSSTSDVTSPSTYSFAGVDIGTANQDRIVVVGVATTSTISGLTIGGVAAAAAGGLQASTAQTSASIWYLKVAAGTTATIAITPVSSCEHMVISVWAIVPASGEPIDAVINTSVATSVALNDLAVLTGGVVIAMFEVNGSGSRASASWSGSDTPTERADADIEARSYAVYDFLTTESNTTRDLTLSSAGGIMAAAAASWR